MFVPTLWHDSRYILIELIIRAPSHYVQSRATQAETGPNVVYYVGASARSARAGGGGHAVAALAAVRGASRAASTRGGVVVKIIVGLGNPGARYAHTRHNVGFDTVDVLAQRASLAWTARRMHAALAEGVLGGERVLLAKPQTYMNDSGLAV